MYSFQKTSGSLVFSEVNMTQSMSSPTLNRAEDFKRCIYEYAFKKLMARFRKADNHMKDMSLSDQYMKFRSVQFLQKISSVTKSIGILLKAVRSPWIHRHFFLDSD